MFRSYWVPVLAAVGLVGIALAAEQVGGAHIPNQPRTTTGQQNAGEHPVFLPIKNERKGPQENSSSKTKPCDNTNSELCQEWHMAQSAERQTKLIGRQNTIIFWEAIGSGASVVLSILAIIISVGTAIVAIKTARAELRAYISVDFSGTKTTRDPNSGAGFFSVDVEFQNCGKTPAYKLRPRGRLIPIDYPLPATYVFEKTPPPDGQSIITLNPGKGFVIPCQSMIFTKESADQILSGTSVRLYAVGEIEYVDTFGKEHHTNFCSHVDFSSRGGKAIWGASERHNDCD